MGIWIIICIQKPCHHFLQTFRPLRMLRLCSAIVHFILNNCLYFVCYGWSAQTLPKRWFGNYEYDVILWRHKQRTPNTVQMTPYVCHWMKSPNENCLRMPLAGYTESIYSRLLQKWLTTALGRDPRLKTSGDSKEGPGWAIAPRFLVGSLSFFLNFPFKFIWMIYTLDNFRPAIF